MIVLQGDEKKGKSLFFRELVGKDHFDDNFTFGLSSKEIIEQTRGKIVVEIAELSHLSEKAVEHVKHLVSRQSDRARLTWDVTTSEIPRAFVLVGTTNNEKPLVSRTGNRRFLICKIEKHLDVQWLRENREQIWAEMIKIEAEYGEVLELPNDTQAEATARQEAAVELDAIEETIIEAISEHDCGRIRNGEAYRLLGMDTTESRTRSPKTGRLVRAAFKRLGWSEYNDGKGTRWWRKAKDPAAPAVWPEGYGPELYATRISVGNIVLNRFAPNPDPNNPPPTRPIAEAA